MDHSSNDIEFRTWINDAYRPLSEAIGRIARTKGVHEDLLHDVLVRLFERRAQITSYEMLLAYGLTLAKWRTIDAYRRGRHRALHEVPLEGTDVVLRHTAVDASHDGENEFAARDEISRQIQKLPPRMREVMTRTLVGETATEIGTAMSITPATVRSLLRHARYALAKAEAGQ